MSQYPQQGYAHDILIAQEKVAAAQEKYSAGAAGAVDALNRAYRVLSDCTDRLYMCSGGRVQDKR